jgi:hypothetical protein
VKKRTLHCHCDQKSDGVVPKNHRMHNSERVRKMLSILLLLLACGMAAAPQCRYACDDPQCDAVCTPKCAEPRCQVDCSLGTPSGCSRLACHVRCPVDQSPVDSCPQCETVCNTLSCSSHHICQPLCEPTVCTWHCVKPLFCPRPRCELVCERPACQSSAAGAIAGSVLGVLLSLAVMTIL